MGLRVVGKGERWRGCRWRFKHTRGERKLKQGRGKGEEVEVEARKGLGVEEGREVEPTNVEQIRNEGSWERLASGVGGVFLGVFLHNLLEAVPQRLHLRHLQARRVLSPSTLSPSTLWLSPLFIPPSQLPLSHHLLSLYLPPSQPPLPHPPPSHPQLPHHLFSQHSHSHPPHSHPPLSTCGIACPNSTHHPQAHSTLPPSILSQATPPCLSRWLKGHISHLSFPCCKLHFT